jgi:hypothetical protein
LLIAAAVVAFAATTGAAVGPDSSQVELIMYSVGSALAGGPHCRRTGQQLGNRYCPVAGRPETGLRKGRVIS